MASNCSVRMRHCPPVVYLMLLFYNALPDEINNNERTGTHEQQNVAPQTAVNTLLFASTVLMAVN